MYRVTSSHDLRLAPPPREIYRRQGLAIPIRWVIYLATPLLWIGLYLMWVFAGSCALAVFGQNHQATVTSRKIERGPRGTHCRIVYTYRDQGGCHAEAGFLDTRAYDFYPPGAPIPILSVRILGHSMSEPRSHTIGSFWGFAIGVIVWNGFAFTGFYAWCLFPLAQWRIVRYGDAAMGQITGKEKVFVRKQQLGGKAYIYKISYSYPGPDGAALTRPLRVSHPDFELAEEGDQVLVFYDPYRPRRSVLYKYCDYSLRDARGQLPDWLCVQR